jgi:hypothetical protein
MATAKQKRRMPTSNQPASNQKEEIRRDRGAGQIAPRKSRKLLTRAFSQPEGSSERLQAFSEYLNALHDEHAK